MFPEQQTSSVTAKFVFNIQNLLIIERLLISKYLHIVWFFERFFMNLNLLVNCI